VKENTNTAKNGCGSTDSRKESATAWIILVYSKDEKTLSYRGIHYMTSEKLLQEKQQKKHFKNRLCSQRQRTL